MSGSEGLSDSELQESYLGPGGRLKTGALLGTIASAVVLAVTSGTITLIEAWVRFNVFLIEGVYGFIGTLVRTTLGEGAAVVVESWRTASLAAFETGVFAPWVLALEALLVTALVAALWEARPYG